MSYTIQITTQTVSYRSEDGDWMEGASRQIKPARDEVDQFDVLEALQHGGDPVEWAADLLNRQVWPTEASVYPLTDQMDANVSLHRSTEHPYRDETEEVSVWLTGDWTPVERARVFVAALKRP